jgi:thiol peroxidase
MNERTGEVTLKGNPVTVLGHKVQVGEKARDFELTANDMSAKRLSDYSGKVKIISVVPSLDTSVCDKETRRFNEEAAALGEHIVVLTVSVDTPMAQKRWCAAHGIENVQTLSDFKTHQFGTDYGVRMKEPGLLARQVMVIDQDDVVQYVQLVGEVGDEPDYDAAVNAAKDCL